jgi:excisionase family DNA binding protein
MTIPADTAAVVKVPALLSVRTVAQLLDLSPRTIRRRIDEGILPAVREHDRTMVRADELRDYIDRLERIGQAPSRRRRRRVPRQRGYDFLAD